MVRLGRACSRAILLARRRPALNDRRRGQVEASVGTSLSLPLRLVFLVAGTTLPLILFAAAIVSLNYEADRKEAGARILEVTRSMMLVVDRELHSTIAALRVLALSLALQHDDLNAFRQQAGSFLRDLPDAANLVLADLSGRQVLN